MSLALIEAKLLADQTAEAVLDLGVARYRGLSAVGGIQVQVVSAAMTVQDAARLPQFFEEGSTFQTSTSMGFLSAPAGLVAGAASAITSS